MKKIKRTVIAILFLKVHSVIFLRACQSKKVVDGGRLGFSGGGILR
jgi:hypothetical protein